MGVLGQRNVFQDGYAADQPSLSPKPPRLLQEGRKNFSFELFLAFTGENFFGTLHQENLRVGFFASHLEGLAFLL